MWLKKRRNNEALWKASNKGDFKAINKLLDKETSTELTAEVNSKGLNNWTALHLASHEN